MTTREKVIVGLMCLTIVYGAYELIGSNTSRKKAPSSPEDPIGELKSFVAEIGQKLNRERPAGDYAYIVTQAGSTWDKDPFIHSPGSLKKSPPASTAARPSKRVEYRAKFAYTGFMQLGNVKMAIINGTEYAVGEAMDDRSFYVKSISPQRVVIGKVDGVETIQLPIQEFSSGLVE